jgi:hypothetical protein
MFLTGGPSAPPPPPAPGIAPGAGVSNFDLEIEKYQSEITRAPQQQPGMYQAQPQPAAPPPPPSFQTEMPPYAPPGGVGGYDDMAATPGNSAIFEFEAELFANINKNKKG